MQSAFSVIVKSKSFDEKGHSPLAKLSADRVPDDHNYQLKIERINDNPTSKIRSI